MASRSNAQTFQNRTVYLKKGKNMKRNRRGISATISKCIVHLFTNCTSGVEPETRFESQSAA
jgi:hypothetical protein